MNQIDVKQFLAALSPEDKATFKQDLKELKTRIWKRVGVTPVSGSLKSEL